MKYKVVEVKAAPEQHEYIIAALMGIGFESFAETDHSISGYIQSDLLDEELLAQSLSGFPTQSKGSNINYKVEVLEEKNWNEEWERNFDPVVIDDKVLIKAPFHNVEKQYPYVIWINPKMSFGTGHHETTFLMIKQLLNYDLNQKSLLDVGTGTGILAIMAKLLGASSILTTDIDDWCIENSNENFQLNGVHEIEVKKGAIAQLNIQQQFDIVLANINKNVLLEEIPYYEKLMRPGALLLLSGFYDKDQNDIEALCQQTGLQFTQSDYKNHWACLIFKKS